jgi:hypothetical protein
LSPLTAAVMSHKADVVQWPAANGPMMRLLRVMRASGTRANGIPKLRITWLKTRTRVGLTPAAAWRASALGRPGSQILGQLLVWSWPLTPCG